jgi:hypothetical protein
MCCREGGGACLLWKLLSSSYVDVVCDIFLILAAFMVASGRANTILSHRAGITSSLRPGTRSGVPQGHTSSWPIRSTRRPTSTDACNPGYRNAIKASQYINTHMQTCIRAHIHKNNQYLTQCQTQSHCVQIILAALAGIIWHWVMQLHLAGEQQELHGTIQKYSMCAQTHTHTHACIHEYIKDYNKPQDYKI